MQDGPGPWARFDDLVAQTAQVFEAVQQVLVAQRPEEVVEVLDAVERLASQGKWAFGYVAYEAAPGLDPGFTVRPPVDGLPLAWFAIADAPRQVPVVRHETDRSHLARAAGPWQREWDEPTHARAVATVRSHIAAGETYQCNVTTRLSGPVREDPMRLYRDLALAQRGAHNAYLDTGRFVLASASPELFFETSGSAILMRPMKGTAARGRTTSEDRQAVSALRSSAKEQAENIMIVDLVRNDLARLAVPGSVTVPRLLHTERYETVHQLTSDVTAEMRADVGLTDAFRALFPCGSITGTPKVRTMHIIADVEDSPRGVYCGAIGVVSPPTQPGVRFSARFSVAIRTLLLDRDTETATYGTGGGITWSSEPAAEYRELLAKTRVLDVRPQEFHLIEVMRHHAAIGLRSFDAHVARAADSAAYFGFRFDEAALRAKLTERLAGAGDAGILLSLFRDGSVRIDIEDLPPSRPGPARVALDLEPVDSTQCWLHHKTSRRRPFTTRLARHPEADDVLLVNEYGELTGACTANLAVRLNGVWWTPPLGSGCFPGVERARLIDTHQLGERPLRRQDLARAEAVALVSSLRGWRSATVLTRTAEISSPDTTWHRTSA
ncbi:aminodeoxychorismate synthase component I [Streptomyces sp. SID8361]|uniref:aminodeoxychorismate synthase component I n=1 Tax=Streptomyces sp. MnatMP-M27 TaxID=1839768 RepID=UPI00081DE97E|nr:aminodeoxychorismate synthase component I [Streptomyces sp. MnatMP-M27]MYU09711.1 aminodeoxychorismate synthase component I [Streptomyces sp. SID8361]SCF64564.1 para-aminobenzoate synthetase / 4-amino-4-deoxychorismate lyase [Streptomyces sp. MnatMP-M27]